MSNKYKTRSLYIWEMQQKPTGKGVIPPEQVWTREYYVIKSYEGVNVRHHTYVNAFIKSLIGTPEWIGVSRKKDAYDIKEWLQRGKPGMTDRERAESFI